MLRSYFIFLILLLIASCSSGGVSGGISSLSGSVVDFSLVEPSEVITSEYLSSPNASNLSLVSAYLYNNPADISSMISGSGINVALLDSGISSHSEINDNVISSFDMTSSSTTHYSANYNAGIIAALRDGEGMHGVAFNASIIDIKTHTVASDNLYGNISWITNGLTTANNEGANISYIRNEAINSFSDVNLLNDFKNKVTEVTNNDMVVVTEVGDVTGNDYDPYKIASIVSDASVTNGLMLAVAGLGVDGNVASYSRYCNGIKEFCLSVNSDALTSLGLADGTTMELSTTSGAASTVTGVLALMMEAFPATSKTDLVTLITKYATPKFTDAEVSAGLSRDIGSTGDLSDTYGWGELNVDAIFQPVGSLSIGVSSISSQFLLDDTSLSISTHMSFISDMGLSSALKEVMVLDSYNRPFIADLSDRVKISEQTSSLTNLVFDNDKNIYKSAIYTPKMSLVYNSSSTLSNRLEDLDFSFDSKILKNTSFFVTQGGLAFFGSGNKGDVLQDRFFKDPILSLTTSIPLKIGFRNDFSKKYSFSSSMIKGQDDQDVLAVRNEIGFKNHFADLEASYTFLKQSDQFLDLQGGGAFGIEDNDTSYFGVNAKIKLSKSSNLRFNYYEANSSLNNSHSLISELFTKSKSYGVNFSKEFKNHSKIDVTYSIPFYVDKGNAVINIPSSLTLAGDINSTAITTSFSGQKNEILQIDYKKSISDTKNLKISLIGENNHTLDNSATLFMNYSHVWGGS